MSCEASEDRKTRREVASDILYSHALASLSRNLGDSTSADETELEGRIGSFVEELLSKGTPELAGLDESVLADLKRETYFDYALIHNEMTDKKTSTHISAIISYTLWDNERQRPLFSAVDEVQRPITKPTPEDLEALVRSAVKQIRINLYGGVS